MKKHGITTQRETIDNVVIFGQREDVAYAFKLHAEDLIRLCRIEHFGEDAEGVNRKYDERHAMKIAEAMLDPETMWLEPIKGDLKGDWHLQGSTLSYGEDAYISVDDGQHRLKALDLLNAAERERFTFVVTATKDLPYQRRLVVFRMQTFGKPLSALQMLGINDRLDDWRSDLEREAYKLVLELNSSPHSPLRSMILLEEQEKRPYESKHRPKGINAKGLHSTVRQIIGRNSPLHELSAAKRAEVVMLIVKLAAKIWKKQWGSEQHVLTTARGINALLKLILRSPNFRGVIGDDFTQESLDHALRLAATFDWSIAKHKLASENQIVERLDQSIGRNRSKGEGGSVKA